jgi:hypothetical protein
MPYEEGVSYEVVSTGTNASVEWSPHLHWLGSAEFISPVLDADLVITPNSVEQTASVVLFGKYNARSAKFDAGLLILKVVIDALSAQSGSHSCILPIEKIAFLGSQFGYSLDASLALMFGDEDFQIVRREWGKTLDKVLDLASNYDEGFAEACSIDQIAKSREFDALKLRTLVRFMGTYASGLSYEMYKYVDKPVEILLRYDPPRSIE